MRPHLDWTEADKAVLEKIQRRAVGMVSGLKGQSYEEKLLELNLPSLEERRLQADTVQTFKIVKGIDRVDHRQGRTQGGCTGCTCIPPPPPVHPFPLPSLKGWL